jgi:hypothetical protein
MIDHHEDEREKVQLAVMPIYEDAFLRIGRDETIDVVELVWKPASSVMSDDDYKTELILFADQVDQLRPARILVDLCDFRFVMHDTLWEWRLTNISARYNSAGVERFAFVLRQDSPIPPRMNQSSAGEAFITRAFRSRQQAIDWLTSGQPANAAQAP